MNEEPGDRIVNILTWGSIQRFAKSVDDYCIEHGISRDFRSFLYHGYNGIIGASYNLLINAPLEYLSNSRAFEEYYGRLDIDFKSDIISAQSLSKAFRDVQRDTKLAEKLRLLMGSDSKV